MSRESTPADPVGEGRIVVFQERAIRRVWHQNEW